MIRVIKTLLVAALALWGFIAAHHNIGYWQGTLDAVGAATSMTTFENGATSWQATSNALLIWAGALFIVISKLAGATVCAIATAKMWRHRGTDDRSFSDAKELALVGCGIYLFMLFTGFVVVAETWFELWRSDVMRGPVLDSAFRYAGSIGLIALFVGATDD